MRGMIPCLTRFDSKKVRFFREIFQMEQRARSGVSGVLDQVVEQTLLGGISVGSHFRMPLDGNQPRMAG